MIDTSHGNSEKDYRRQPLVARDITAQLAQGEPGIFGIMMESFLADGRQDLLSPRRSSTAEHHGRLHGLGDDRPRTPRAGGGGQGAPGRGAPHHATA